MAQVTVDDLGFRQQHMLYQRICARTGEAPPVVLANDVLNDPRGTSSLLCERLAIPFSTRMLSWPSGPRSSDGIWATHWYDAVERSTGFEPQQEATVRLTREHAAIARECEPYFQRLYEQRLCPTRP